MRFFYSNWKEILKSRGGRGSFFSSSSIFLKWPSTTLLPVIPVWVAFRNQERDEVVCTHLAALYSEAGTTTKVKRTGGIFHYHGASLQASHQRRAFWSPASHYVLRIIINFLSLKWFWWMGGLWAKACLHSGIKGSMFNFLKVPLENPQCPAPS